MSEDGKDRVIKQTHDVHFFKSGRGKAKNPPNPDFPRGIFFNLSQGKGPTCTIALPYPAPETGQFVVHCNVCGYNGVVTAAGRPDDPTGIKVSCKPIEKGSKCN